MNFIEEIERIKKKYGNDFFEKGVKRSFENDIKVAGCLARRQGRLIDTPFICYSPKYDGNSRNFFLHVVESVFRQGVIYPQPKKNNCKHLRYNRCCGIKTYEDQSPYYECLLDLFEVGNCKKYKECEC
jgi:hypothetical protein